MSTRDVDDVEQALAEACGVWQSGRDGGSSRLRGAARVLTGVPHYFEADFIRDHEEAARNDPAALRHARVILNRLAVSPARPAGEWAATAKVRESDFAGRGLASNLQDAQIEARLDSGSFDMPLFGLSLDREVTVQYGGRFLLEMVGAFPAVPAWLASAVKAEERELITGGRFRVAGLERSDGFTLAKLQWAEPLQESAPSKYRASHLA